MTTFDIWFNESDDDVTLEQAQALVRDLGWNGAEVVALDAPSFEISNVPTDVLEQIEAGFWGIDTWTESGREISIADAT